MPYKSAKLDDVVRFVGGGTPSKQESSFWNGSIPWVSPKDMKSFYIRGSMDSITDAGLRDSACNLIPTGSVLTVVRSGVLIHTLPVALTKVPCALNQDMKAMIPAAQLRSPFLAYWLLSKEQHILTTCVKKGATVQSIAMENLRSQELPLPPLPEQDRIVEILDQADTLRQQRRQADALSQRILPALFQEMFGDVVGNSKSWPISTIGNCVDSRLGKMLDRGKDEEADPQPYLANLNVRWGTFDLGELRTMDFSEADRKEFELLPGDVLICEGGEVGRSAIWRKPDSGIYFQKALHRVRVDPAKLTPEYFQFYMHSMAMNGGLAKHVGNAVIGHLTGVKLKQLEIPLPPLDLQWNFSANYLAAEQLTGHTTTSAATLEALFQTLLHRAFDGSLTAKWREGHAKELLQEVERPTHKIP